MTNNICLSSETDKVFEADQENADVETAKVKSNAKKNVILLENDKKIRQNWIVALDIFFLGSLGFFFVIGILTFLADAKLAGEILISTCVWAGVRAVQLGLIYHFAFNKFGTKWIGFFIFVSPINTAIITTKEFFDLWNEFDGDIVAIASGLFVESVILSLYIYFWIHCRRLYHLNHDIKKRGQSVSAPVEKLTVEVQ